MDMQPTSLKVKMANLIRDLPDDANIEDAMERLLLLYKIEKGIQQADQGRTVSHDEAKHRLRKWLD
jgi:predicted transcriptional regulator